MKKLLDYLKSNSKVIVIIALIFALTVAVVLINRNNGSSVSVAATVSESGMSDTEKKLTAVLSSISGVGETEVMINESDNVINGVIVVCKGADNIMTRNDILNAVSTALNVDKKIIAIYAMN